MRKITAAGGVLYKTEGRNSDPDVLLIYRRGVWDLPKGKMEEGESVEECAIREVQEEVGCQRPVIKQKLGLTFHEYEEDSIPVGKTTHWFSMRTSTRNDFEPQTSEDIEKVEWVPLQEALEKVGYQNLKEVLHSFGEQF